MLQDLTKKKEESESAHNQLGLNGQFSYEKVIKNLLNKKKKATIITSVASRAIFHQEMYLNEACELKS